MRCRSKAIASAAGLTLCCVGIVAHAKLEDHSAKQMPKKYVAVLWRDPGDISTEDLFYGPGGKAHAPHGTFTFKVEDRSGTSPKFDVVDQDGTNWRVKMGPEARPETAASRLLWAIGYFANEDYFMPVLHVENMRHLRRGANLVPPDHNVHDVRLKRHMKDEHKIGFWSWSDNPFAGTRELNGLRVMMAFLNNWDLRDNNNSVYLTRDELAEERFAVSDLGASFGPVALDWALKGRPAAYCGSTWIRATAQGFIDFNVPSTPSGGYYFALPLMARSISMLWIGRHIPRPDARWIGDLLSRLSPKQIEDSFRAAGYSPDEVAKLSRVLERRISDLEKL